MKNLLTALLFTSMLVFAADPVPPATRICVVDTLISAEAFDRPESFAKEKQPGTDGWRKGIGTWSIKDGAAYAVQEGPTWRTVV